MVHFIRGQWRARQVKLYDSSTTCAVPERFCSKVSSLRGSRPLSVVETFVVLTCEQFL